MTSDLEPRTSRLPLRVRFCETDLMGIVHHANYLTYFKAGRVDWRHKRGVTSDSWAREGIHDYRVLGAEEVLWFGETLLAGVGHDLAPRRIPETIRDVLLSAELPPDQWA